MIKLDNFQIKEQKKSYTCGYASLSMISCFLGNKVDEEELEEELPIGSMGTIPSMFKKLLKRHLPNYNIKLEYIRKKKFVNNVEHQLEMGIPVPIICLAENKFKNPKLVGHYLVIIGIDKLNSKFYIADPFNECEREIAFEEIYKQLSFNESKGNTLMLYKYIRMLVKLRGFMAFIISKNN